MKAGQTQLWFTSGSLNQGISAVLLERTAAQVCACPCDRGAWTSVHRASWCETSVPALDHGHLTNPESLQQSGYGEVNYKGKQTKKESCISFHKSILFVFVLAEGTKPACFKIKTSAAPSTCQPNSRLRCGSSRCTCRGPVTPCYSWWSQDMSRCLEQRRENRHKDKPPRYKRSTSNKAAPVQHVKSGQRAADSG